MGPLGRAIRTSKEDAMTAVVTLYCIADEAGFRLLRGRGGEMTELLSTSAEAFGDVKHEFAKSGRNRTGRGATSFGHDTKSAAEIERPRLARHAVSALEAEWAKGGADRIVLAAGPKMLGALREAMPEKLAGHVTLELAKDFSDVPAHALHQQLQDIPQLQ
jgi:protein required for attachment to host cells